MDKWIITKGEGMHEGHRKRMYEKLKSGANLFDHELLEILLFNALPRKNTNPIAHSLIQTFGSLAGVFEADVDELTSVEGVGENVATYIKCVGECMKRTSPANAGIAVLKSYKDVEDFVTMRLRGKTAEVLEFYFLDKTGKVVSIHPFTCDDAHRVDVASQKIASVFATSRPYSVIIAHNHPRSEATPSENDNLFTKEMQVICSLNEVNLQDHCIYGAGGGIYSYFRSGEIDKIKNSYTFRNILDEYMKNNKK